jgi:hypothetical protein
MAAEIYSAFKLGVAAFARHNTGLAEGVIRRFSAIKWRITLR